LATELQCHRADAGLSQRRLLRHLAERRRKLQSESWRSLRTDWHGCSGPADLRERDLRSDDSRDNRERIGIREPIPKQYDPSGPNHAVCEGSHESDPAAPEQQPHSKLHRHEYQRSRDWYSFAKDRPQHQRQKQILFLLVDDRYRESVFHAERKRRWLAGNHHAGSRYV